jgi:hypothetical protein
MLLSKKIKNCIQHYGWENKPWRTNASQKDFADTAIIKFNHNRISVNYLDHFA